MGETARMTPRERALQAGREIMAEGQVPTGDRIRDRAAVAQGTAMLAARQLREESSGKAPVPVGAESGGVPAEYVAATLRFIEVAEAAARAAFEVDRQGHESLVRDMVDEIEQGEAERIRLEAEVARLEAEVARLSAALAPPLPLDAGKRRASGRRSAPPAEQVQE